MRRKVKQTVLRVLQKDASARDSGQRLIWAVCREMGHEIMPEQVEAITNLPNFSSIIRARAKIQEQGRFTPSPQVRTERQKYKR
ncbi:MAG TPA: hypothetical protein VF600_18760 [Abditibacteriaceae bacterium]|jgi:hypothetical protein